MGVRRLEDDFLEHLRVEFGDAGSRAVEFLGTVPELLDGELPLGGRVGEMAAYCCREALISIVNVGETGEQAFLSDFADAVVSAAHGLDVAPWTQQTASGVAFSELLERISELERFRREGVRTNEARLISAVIRRAGVEPLRSGAGPVVEFQQLLRDLNDGLHSECSRDDAQQLWLRCCALLVRLFRPPSDRHAELERLAAVDEPTSDDLEIVLNMVATTTHLQHFFRDVRSPRWLHLFLGTDLFEQGVSDLWWTAGAAADRFTKDGHSEGIDWLSELARRYGSDVDSARCIANIARRIGRPAVEILLQVARRHLTDWPIVLDAASAVRSLDADDDSVRRLCDVLFSESCRIPHGVPDRLADHLAEGITEDNSRDRIELMVFKLRRVPLNDRLFRWLSRYPAGSLSDPRTLDPPMQDRRSSILAACLVKMLSAAWAWMPLSDLLTLLDDIPQPLRCRLRSWLMACAPAVTSSQLAHELEVSMSSRRPCGDDPRLVDRTTQMIGNDAISHMCSRAFGEPPTTAAIETAVAASDVPPEWIRVANWTQMLPTEVVGAWASPGAALADRFGLRSPQALSRLEPTRAQPSESPYSVEELGSMAPIEAARLLAEWPSDARQSHIVAFDLGRTLEIVVKQDPASWFQSPEAVIEALRHIPYIVSYLGAAKDLVGEHPLPVSELIDQIWQRCVEPSDSVPQGASTPGLPGSWRDLRVAGVELIRALVKGEVDLGDSAARAWDIVDAAARDLTAESGFSEDTDSGTRALNRPCTRAFETAIIMSAATDGASGRVRPAMVDLLSWAIRLKGNDGTEYRAVLAQILPWLRNTVSTWFAANHSVLLGPDAPLDLAQETVDAALQWGPPDRWLFENCAEMIRNAVLRGAEDAISQFLIAAIWECDGYRISQVVQFLAENPDVAADAASRLGYLVSHDDVDPKHMRTAADLWEAFLDSPASGKAAGFGSMSQAETLDFERWASLTVQTLKATGGRIDDALGVADRAMTQPVTELNLELLDEMIRGRLESWDLRHIADNITGFLEDAQDLNGTPPYQSLETALLERDMITDRGN